MWFTLQLENSAFIKINNDIKPPLLPFNKNNIDIKNNKLFFEQLWSIKPYERPILKIYGKELQAPRYFQNYGIDYYFSGKMHYSYTIPDILQPFLDYVNKIEKTHTFNNILVNWYEDNNHYISYHADNEKNIKKNSNIYVFSFGAERMFYIKNNNTKLVRKFNLKNNSCIVMGNTFQKYYKHSIPKTKINKERRVSITIRQFI